MNVMKTLESISTDDELQAALSDVAKAWLAPAKTYAATLNEKQLLMERICTPATSTIERVRLEHELQKLSEDDRTALNALLRQKYKRSSFSCCSCAGRHRRRATAQSLSATAAPTAADVLTG